MKQELSILLLEDVVPDAVLIEHELHRAGIAATTKRVETREEFLDQLQHHSPDLILSDHGLPSFDGFTALRVVKEQYPETPFIFVAQASGPEEVIRSFENGATDFVLKGQMGAQLIPAIRRALSRKVSPQHDVLAETNRLLADAEQRCRQRTAELDAATKELDAFSYSVSHDLRAPLRHIDGFVEMLQHRLHPTLDDASREYLGIISTATKQMNGLIEALLSFSRISRAALFRSRVALDKVVQSVIRDLRFETEGRQVEWVVSPLPTVEGDPNLLRQVFVNLISNALKFTRPREKARIEIGQIDNSFEQVFFVRDNGIGFSMEFSAKLFGIFQRLHSPNDFPGAGVGLANVRRIIQRHGGRVWAEATPDAGATFYFSLPRPSGGPTGSLS
jgi:signal transduction histidine kinase